MLIVMVPAMTALSWAAVSLFRGLKMRDVFDAFALGKNNVAKIGHKVWYRNGTSNSIFFKIPEISI